MNVENPAKIVSRWKHRCLLDQVISWLLISSWEFSDHKRTSTRPSEGISLNGFRNKVTSWTTTCKLEFYFLFAYPVAANYMLESFAFFHILRCRFDLNRNQTRSYGFKDARFVTRPSNCFICSVFLLLFITVVLWTYIFTFYYIICSEARLFFGSRMSCVSRRSFQESFFFC